MPLNESYGELAYAILVWDKRQEAGTPRWMVLKAELELRRLADALRAVGYDVGTGGP